ncbi:MULTISPECIES: Htur_1727 family rSAM-partnered candidate RiPP [Haloarcula]|uniref:Htur_1727 family rSAM-partnered candidate RiPP n=1 Tax=Haloarcula TaxID=2237 RepID=UPI0023EC4D66|nr:Htur_1727 family rSAM-partnered candidate RiPP [Halomicroarcula sp. XH51]
MERLDNEVDAPRGATSREWELFVSEDPAEPLTHAGSVSAPTAAVAREQASALFGHSVERLWLCPADETRRFQTAEQSLVADDAEANDDATMDRKEMAAETLQGDAE